MSQSIEFAKPLDVESPEGCFFYHTVELPTFGVVHGQWDLRGKFEEYVSGVEVEGKSVLDVGTATGFLSFEAERRGAARVVSHDCMRPSSPSRGLQPSGMRVAAILPRDCSHMAVAASETCTSQLPPSR